MTIQTVTAKNATRTETYRFVTEASTLGCPPGFVPGMLTTTLGNGLSLSRIKIDDDGTAHYRQLLGCVVLVLLND